MKESGPIGVVIFQRMGLLEGPINGRESLFGFSIFYFFDGSMTLGLKRTSILPFLAGVDCEFGEGNPTSFQRKIKGDDATLLLIHEKPPFSGLVYGDSIGI